jgi:CDP-diacylglycerol--serine O-phosphatidyltransferase
MIYLWSMGSIEGPGWAAVMFYSTCAALRLARFNTKIGDPDMPPWAYNYFTGVPAPAGAGIAMLPMIISFEWPEGPFTIATLNAVWLVAVGLLMVSRIPTFAFKKAKVPHKYVLPTLVGMGLLTAALVSSPWLTIAAFGVLYLACIPFSYRSYRALTLEAQRIAGKVEEIPPPAT